MRVTLVLLVVFVTVTAWTQIAAVKMDFEAPAQFEQWLPDSDQWAVADGVLRQSRASLNGTCCFLPEAFGDVTVEVRFFIHPTGSGVKASGLIYRAADENHFYYIHFDSKNSQVVFVRQEPGLGWTAENTHRHRGVSITPEQWHTARVEVTGATHKVFLDGALLFEHEDDVIPAGVVGLRVGQGDISFDDFEAAGTPAQLEEEFTVTKVPYITVCEDAGAGGYEAFPDICRTPDGELLVVFYAGYGHVSFPTDDLPNGARICMVRSTDDGRTWSDAEVVVDTPLDDRDSSITQLRNGDLLVTFMTYSKGRAPTHAVQTIRSSDNGATWSEPLAVPVIFDGNQAVSEPVTELADGTLLLPIYGSWADNSKPGTPCGVLISTDGGRTWPEHAILEPAGRENLHEPAIVVLPDGRIYMQIRPVMMWSESVDGGRTWSPVQPMDITGHAPYLLLTSQNVLISGFRHPPTRSTSLAWSTDFGATWSDPLLVDNVVGGYPSMAELPDGRIIFVYYTEGSGSDIRCVFLRATPDGVTILPKEE